MTTPKKSTTKKEAPVAEKSEKDVKMQAARTRANRRHREEDRERYNAILVEEAAKEGIDWKPRPTQEEKDREKLRELLAANPGLREELLTEDA